jgi:N-acetylmuramoyl-L-alanine amidase
VKQGECLSSLAKKYGFADYMTIYDHPNNAELKAKRQNPNVVFPDDEIYIPDFELREVDAATERKHRFQLIGNKTVFRIVVKDGDGEPFASVRYELKIEKETYEGTTDQNGKLEQKIPADARKGALILFSDEEDERKVIGMFSLDLGHLDPVEEITGVQSRLNNLGYGCGRVDGVAGRKTGEALRAFQAENGLPVTGEADRSTREKLRLLHDWQ